MMSFMAKVKRETLCWKCQNCWCSWLQWMKPVEGWEAIGHKYMGQIKRYTGDNPRSYTVINCPDFKSEK